MTDKGVALGEIADPVRIFRQARSVFRGDLKEIDDDWDTVFSAGISSCQKSQPRLPRAGTP